MPRIFLRELDMCCQQRDILTSIHEDMCDIRQPGGRSTQPSCRDYGGSLVEIGVTRQSRQLTNERRDVTSSPVVSIFIGKGGKSVSPTCQAC